MPTELKKTRIKRKRKALKLGAKSKNQRENHGTTPLLPLEGPLPALRFGRIVNPESIVVPSDALKA